MRPGLLAAGLLLGWFAPMTARPAAESPGSLPPEAVQLNREAAAADPAAALRLYVRSLRLAPSNVPALHGLGRILLDQERAAESLKVFRKLDELSPGDPDIRLGLATALSRLPGLRRADVREALDIAGQAVELRPESPAAWHLLSVLRHLNGEYTSAADAARRAVELDAQAPVHPETTALYQQQENACRNAILVFSPLD
ncbi:MAG: tetratricopeptide repeat protein [Lentisphaerae bacterium]|nr:tetratricopeptide repeat protein [Lentisphaerota bacterium]